jgi:hypothetical protein
MRSADRHRKRRPQFEALESWIPLSGGAGALPGALAAHAVAPIVARQGPTIALSGTVRGGYFSSQVNPDKGATYRLGVAGKLSPLGQTGDSGQIQTTGFIAMGMARGNLTLSAPRGNVKLTITGPLQPGFSTLPGTLSYTITGGTRAYRGATGSGAIAVSLTSSFVSKNFGLISLSFRPGTTMTTNTTT